MSRGSPDHTTLIDVNFSHYIANYSSETNLSIPSDIETTFFNEDFVGLFNFLIVKASYQIMRFRIYLDDNLVMDMNPHDLHYSFGMIGHALGARMGVTVFDEVWDSYTMWFDFTNLLYVHKNLTVKAFQDSGVNKILIYWWLHYQKYQP